MQAVIRLKNILTHNLKGFDLTLPLNKLIVITGPSGSGKSSLAFYTLAEAGRKRLLRLFEYSYPLEFGKVEAEIEGPLPPVIALSQGIKEWYPYKTVGEFLGVRDFLEAIFSLKGEWACPRCGTLNSIVSPSRIIFWYQDLPEGTKFYFLVPIQEKSKKALEFFLSQGYTRFFLGSQEVDLSEGIPEDSFLNKAEKWYLLLDRMIKRGARLERLLENIRLARELSRGKIVFRLLSGEELIFNISRVCENCGHLLPTSWKGCEFCEGRGYLKRDPCEKCRGLKLSSWVLKSRLCGYSLEDLLEMDISTFSQVLKKKLSEESFKALAEDLGRKLSLAEKFLDAKLCLSTPVFRLTTGQKKAIELLLLFSNPVSGCLYILDEPTLGIDVNLREVLLDLLKSLVKKGNGVIVVEHDPYFISHADFVVELGHGGGEKGGYLVASLPFKDFLSSSSLTASYLKGERKLERFATKKAEKLILDSGIELLKGSINLVWGDIGPEKEKLWAKIQQELREKGFSVIDAESQLKFRDRDTVATFSGLWDALREFLLKLPEVKARGFKARHLSFFTKEGMCPACSGKGYRLIKGRTFEERVVCEECLGKRLNPEVLSLRVKGFTLFELLDFTVSELLTVFERLPGVKERAGLMEGLGISYLKLSQGVFELSGGERSRLFLCRKLSKKNWDRDTFVFLAYPFQGLHFSDLQKFINWCRISLEKGVSFVILETNPLAWFVADQVIEPEEGKAFFPDEMHKFYQRFFEA